MKDGHHNKETSMRRRKGKSNLTLFGDDDRTAKCEAQNSAPSVPHPIPAPAPAPCDTKPKPGVILELLDGRAVEQSPEAEEAERFLGWWNDRWRSMAGSNWLVAKADHRANTRRVVDLVSLLDAEYGESMGINELLARAEAFFRARKLRANLDWFLHGGHNLHSAQVRARTMTYEERQAELRSMVERAREIRRRDMAQAGDVEEPSVREARPRGVMPSVVVGTRRWRHQLRRAARAVGAAVNGDGRASRA